MPVTQQLEVEARAWRSLKHEMAQFYNISAEDEGEVLADTLEGATSLHEIVAVLAREARQRELDALACDVRIKEIEGRKARHEHAYDFIRQAIARAMTDCEVPRVVRPDVTVSCRQSEPRLMVSSVDMLPEDFIRIERVAAKKKINDHYAETGEIPAGCALKNGAPVVTMRFK